MEIVHLLPTFSEMEFEIFGPSPPPQRFIDMQHRHVGEVWNTSDCFQSVKTGEITICKECIKYSRLEKACNVM